MKASLRWTGTRDLDLAAYWRRGEDRGLVYYGHVGAQDEPPWIELLEGCGVRYLRVWQ